MSSRTVPNLSPPARSWSEVPLFEVPTVNAPDQPSLFDSPRSMGCYCPSDCGCHFASDPVWLGTRPNLCGCKAHS